MNEAYRSDMPMDAPVRERRYPAGQEGNREPRPPSTVEACLERANELRSFAEELQHRMNVKLEPILLSEPPKEGANCDKHPKQPKSQFFDDLNSIFFATRQELRGISDILDRVDL